MTEKGRKRAQYKKMPMEVAVHLKYLHQDGGVSGRDLVKRYPQYSKSSIYRHMKRPIGVNTGDRRRFNKGRPRKLDEREERLLVRQVPLLRKELQGCMTIHDMKEAAGVKKSVSDTTVGRCLNKAGYRLRVSAHKGVLSENDLRIRVQYAKQIRREYPADFWWTQINFYLDGTGFVYKKNPCAYAMRCKKMTWRKRSERLSIHCTAPGRKEGTGGRVARFMVAIAYNRGVTLCHEYTGQLCGELFAKIVKQHFRRTFKRSKTIQNERLFLQDGDPSQNSAVAYAAMDKIDAKMVAIPARSPDLNPIENIFHIVKEYLRREAIKKKITQETYGEFVKRIERAFQAIPIQKIDKTILSMPRRIETIIKRNGERLKY